ncbi:disease resistance protein RUN1-like isoform X1 [Malus sylvestris]|uniref:disease resistance protein RUN1-like isoform X1 n=1 Tax=Malus sylvestris TaxID=3752 RepID=UPI0021AC42F9|nr:disease resistance protein RUN1-like isoform X1 [Malus sylvestris]
MCCRSFSSSSPAADSDVADSTDVPDVDVVDIASSSSSTAAPADADDTKKYDVFISFRGEDTRRTFTSHLHAALLENKITTYIDDELKRGDEIAPGLLKAIKESELSVIVLSKDYASSTWCLDELVHILECKEKHGRLVIPIFYDTLPSDVRKQQGSYEVAFAELEQRFKNSINKVRKWRDALTNAANLSGFDSKKYGTDAVLVKKVVEDIWTKLCRASSCDLKGLFGIESRIEQVESLLGIHSSDACITVGIWGMGGIGKTTLAETVFHRLSSKFEASCFVKNVRENSEKADGLDHLEKTLLKEILKEEGLSIGSISVRERLSRTKVLIVLDDVSSSMQMDRLAGDRLQFGTGSRIIITTRDRGTFGKTVEKDNIYEVEVLKSNDALQLFNSRAFKDSTCRIDYKELVEKAVAYAKGVPLALTVLGSLFFNCKSKEEWEDEFNKLKRFPSKDIFLDIACFHKGKSVVEVKRMLDVREFFATSGIRILIEMSLISIDSEGGMETIEMGNFLQVMRRETIEMHDLLQEMGRKIVQQQDIKDPGKRSRLFNVEDVNRVLRSNKETPNVEAIQVNWCDLQERPLERADFKKMSNLIMLIVDSGKFHHKLTTSLDLPDSLRYLKWRGYPLESLPSNFCPKNLVELHMQASEVKKLWKEEQILFNLQVINLQGCESLVEIPSYFQHLDKLTHLDLECCRSLKYLPKMPGNIQYLNLNRSGIKELPESVWSNKNISCLNLNKCVFMKFPSNWCKFKNIEILNLSCCSKFENFPEILEPMEHLKSLSLSETAVKELPSSICELKYLERLDLYGCSRFSKFPEILKPMEHLVSLSLQGTAVEMLPSSIGNLNRLQDLNLSGCYQLKDVPTSIYSLTNLKRLHFHRCLRLEKLPSSSAGFLSLEELELSSSSVQCGRLEKLPSSSVGFLSLEELDLGNSGILEIPASIKQASRLSILNLNCCERLQSIPELPVLCNVKASNCTSLKIVSSSRTALAQGWDKPKNCFKVFSNCPKLDNNSRSNIMDEAQITIMRMATVAPFKYISWFREPWFHNPWPQIKIACPGKEIPNWFSYQNEGSSVDIELCPDWFRTGLFGFALSVVLSGVSGRRHDWRVRANFIVKFMGESHELFSFKYIIPGISYDQSVDQHHVHVWNEGFRSEEVGKNCSPDVYKLAKEASVVFFCPVGFEDSEDSEDSEAGNTFVLRITVERCGICPLYAEDAEKFNFGHEFMSRGPKVGEETRQDDFESNGTIGLYGQHTAKKPKILKQSLDTTSGGPWSHSEDQALVVLVHDMGPNWELISDAINSTLHLKCIFRKPKECKERHKILMDMNSGDGADSAEDSGSSQPYPSPLPGIPKGSARELFQRLQEPMEEDVLKSRFEKIIKIGHHYRRSQVSENERRVAEHSADLAVAQF